MIRNENVIIVFTKDRPKILISTLSKYHQISCPIIILDDSSKQQNRNEIKNRICISNNLFYHGRAEQKKLINRLQFEHSFLKPFINRLGVKNWNLGYARNYAIILAKAYGFKKVLFMDDDITITNTKLIFDVFEKLNKYHFVGSKVIGMVDDSVSGHIVRELKLKPEEYFSGGFIAFRTSEISEYFINEYNEDWIWMYLHNFKLKFHLFGQVLQQPFDPFQNGENKALAQEFGELLVDGVKEAFETKNMSLLTDLIFWKKILKEKADYYKILLDKCILKKKVGLQSIIKIAANHSMTIESNLLFTTFNNYFEQREKWKSVLSKIESQPMEEEKINYPSADGLKLSGIFATPPNSKTFALLAHGITMNKNEWNNLHFRIAKDLYNRNISSFRFDYRGHGESDGKMRDVTIVGELMDVKGSMNEVAKKWKKKTAIIASSFGAGSSVLYAALNPDKVSCLILLNPVLDYEATFLNPKVAWGKESFNKKGFKNLEQNGYLLLDEEYELDAKLIAEFQIIKPFEYLQKIKCPVLTIHGNRDSMVPYEISKKYGKPNKDSKFVTIEKAEHGFVKWNDEEGNDIQSMENQKKVTQLLIEWIEKYS